MLIRNGSRGPEVRSFQSWLIANDYLNDVADGVAGHKTVAAIKKFQSSQSLAADGVAGNDTLNAARKLGYKSDAKKKKAEKKHCFECGRRWPSDDERVEIVASRAGIPVDVLRAFKMTESGGRASAIRFEPHLFLRKRPDLNNQIPFTKGSKSFSVVRSETDRPAFEKAYSFDKDVAVRSTSWGLYQVLGGFLIAAYDTPENGVEAFDADPEGASDLIVAAWFRANPKAQNAANEKDWKTLTRYYNGPGNVEHYSAVLATNYEKVTA